MAERGAAFGEFPVGVRLKLFALWCSVVFFFVYGDYFQLYQPGQLRDMVAGTTAFGAISQGILFGISAVLMPACLMPVLSLFLPAAIDRWANVVVGALYIAIMILAIRGQWRYYIAYGLIEIALLALVIRCAWTWPKQVEV